MAGERLQPSRRGKRGKRAAPSRRSRSDGRTGSGRGDRKGPRAGARSAAASAASAVAGTAGALFEALREWRLAEAKRTGLPAFRIMNDRTLRGVATETPLDEDALLRVAGIGPGLSRRYGVALLRIVARFAGR